MDASRRTARPTHWHSADARGLVERRDRAYVRRMMRGHRLAICMLFVFCGLPAVVSATEPPPLSFEGTASALQRQLLGANAATEAIALRLRATFSLPALPAFAPISLNGHGTIPYQWHDGQVALRNADLPRLQGNLKGPQIPGGPYQLRVRGQVGSSCTIRWDAHAVAITLQGLRLEARVFPPGGTTALLRFALPPLQLTTGTIQVAGQPVAGALELRERRATLVGTFRMPKTGLAPLDAQLRSAEVLVTLRGQIAE